MPVRQIVAALRPHTEWTSTAVLQRCGRGLRSFLAARPSNLPGRVTAKPHEPATKSTPRCGRRTYRQLTAPVRCWAGADKVGYRASIHMKCS